jgi:hypothetical protein
MTYAAARSEIKTGDMRVSSGGGHFPDFPEIRPEFL